MKHKSSPSQNHTILLFPFLTLLPLKVDMLCLLLFFTYWSIKEHFTSIVGLEGNRIYSRQFLQLRNNGFRVKGGSATANPSKMSLSQFCIQFLCGMSTFNGSSVSFKFYFYGWHEALYFIKRNKYHTCFHYPTLR
jgi:hypothetical protein